MMGCLLFIQLQRSAASASHHWDKPHLRPLALCVSLEVEAEGRVGVPVVEGVGLVASRFQFFLNEHLLSSFLRQHLGQLLNT